MRLDYEAKAEVARFVNKRITENFSPYTTQPVGVRDKQGNLVAGWIWHNWSPEANVIEFSGAADTPRWMTRKILHELFGYAFTHNQMVVTRNSANNTRLHRQLEAFGFEKIILPRLYGRCEDCFYWFLTIEAWHRSPFYISEYANGQKRQRRANAA